MMSYIVLSFFFFFQAEDGIRDKLVTGVQTCALPISPIWALALATRLSAAAISGRLSSSSEGTLIGTCGGGAVRGSGGRLNSAGGFPIRIATACSYCARNTPTSIAAARVV